MSASARTRREVSMREVGALAAGAIVLSVVMTWPLVLHLGENVPKDLTDPLPQAWQIACYVLWSTDGFPELVNGRSSVEPAWTARLVRSTHRFPNRASVERLRHVGVRSVILDLDLVAGTPQEHVAARPIAGLGIDRERRSHAIVYDIDP